MAIYFDVLVNLFYPQRCIGCSRRASDVLCRECSGALPFVGHPLCGRCGAPAAFEVYGCGECRDRNFGFDGARAPLRYEGVRRELVHTLKYRGYLRVVEKVMAPLMARSLDNSRGSTRWYRCRCTARGSPSAGSTRRSSWREG
jgi:predicted amidophosphoribosyltransferase